MLNRLVGKYGKLIVVSCAVMLIGIIVFLISIPLFIFTGIDLDVIGFFTFVIALAFFIIGIVKKQKLKGWRLIVLTVIAAMLLLTTAVPLLKSTVQYLLTRKPLGG